MRSPPEHGWLLGALSAEMDRTREGLGRVEALVARLAPHAPDADRRQTAVEAQELDVLSQTLAAVSTVLTRLGDGAFHRFESLFEAREGKLGVVVTFLGLLTLAKEQLVDIVQEAPLAPIYVKSLAVGTDPTEIQLSSEFDEAANDDA